MPQRHLPSDGSLPKWLHQPGLGPADASGPELRLGLLCLPKHASGRLGWKHSGWASEQRSGVAPGLLSRGSARSPQHCRLFHVLTSLCLSPRGVSWGELGGVSWGEFCLFVFIKVFGEVALWQSCTLGALGAGRGGC